MSSEIETAIGGDWPVRMKAVGSVVAIEIDLVDQAALPSNGRGLPPLPPNEG